MNPIIYGAIRTGIQIFWGMLVSHFTVLAVIPTDTAVDWIMTAVVGAGYTALALYFQTRTGTDFWSKVARFAGRVMMLGLVKTPTYTPSAPVPVPAPPATEPTKK